MGWPKAKAVVGAVEKPPKRPALEGAGGAAVTAAEGVGVAAGVGSRQQHHDLGGNPIVTVKGGHESKGKGGSPSTTQASPWVPPPPVVGAEKAYFFGNSQHTPPEILQLNQTQTIPPPEGRGTSIMDLKYSDIIHDQARECATSNKKCQFDLAGRHLRDAEEGRLHAEWVWVGIGGPGGWELGGKFQLQ